MPKENSKSVVFILGAGCSQEDRVPLIHDFFEVSYKVMKNLYGNKKEKFQKIFNYRDKVLPESNIEELFSYLDLERYLFLKKGKTLDDLNTTRKDLIYLIAKTVEQNIIDIRSENYNNFLKNHLVHLKNPVIITFNWELLIDNVIFDKINRGNSTKISNIYGVVFKRLDENGVHKNLNKSRYKLLKLHGSLNWLHCRDCEDIKRFFVSGKESVLRILEGHPKQCPEDGRYLDPIIVPPSFQKIESKSGFSYLNDIWLEAKKTIINADKIVVIGYSFPEDDVHFKHFFRGALVANYESRNQRVKIDVINYKRYIQDKLDFEKHYNDILSIPNVKIDVNFKYQKFSEFAQNNHLL